MDINDEELFNATLTDEPIETTVEAEAPEPEVSDGVNRDEQGRFAPKPAEPEVAAVPQPEPQGKDEAHVPSWRLREEREAREAADRRFSEAQAQWQRQFQELQNRLPKPEEPKAPDVFEDPNKFLEHGVRQAIDPVESKIGKVIETFSQRDAIREHGQETVTEAYRALDQAANKGDPRAVAMVARVKQSMDPYGEIVGWYKEASTYNEVSKAGDLQAWFNQELEKRLADPQFASAQLQRIQSGVRNPPQGQTPTNTIKLPPSIGKMPSSQSASDDAGDMSDAGLFAHATR